MILPAKIGTVPPAVTALDKYLLAERCVSDEGDASEWFRYMQCTLESLSDRDRAKLRARPRVPGYCADHGWHGGRCATCRMVAK